MKYMLFRPLLLFSAIATSAAQAQPELPRDKWIVDWGEHRCSLVRRSSGADGVTMVLRASLGAHRPELVLTKEGKGAPLPSLNVEVDVSLMPDGPAMTGYGQALRSEGGERILFVSNLPEDFFDRFAASKGVVVERKKRELVRIAYSNASAAIRNLRICNDDLLASWGVDPKILNALQRKPLPTANAGSWVSDNDYPEEAIRARKSGTAVVRFTVGTDGRPAGCTPVVSSGSELLDAQTCRILTSRARFEPALGPDGQPIAVKTVQTVHWVLP